MMVQLFSKVKASSACEICWGQEEKMRIIW